MKRILTIFLAAVLLLSIAGCSAPGGGEEEIAFYYKRARLSYGEENGVITAEYRSLDIQNTETITILNLYLEGPKVTELTNVFPVGCEVLEFSLAEDVATVHFNKIFGQLQDMSRTLACVCMSRTVMELTGAKCVRIRAEDVKLGSEDYLEFDENSVLYFDSSR